MDYWTAFVAKAHLQLRLQMLTPEMIAMATTPVLPAPMEFAGLKSRLARARGLEQRAAVAGPRLDAALDIIETGVGVLETHAPELEKYGADLMNTITGMLAPSNGGPPADGSEVPATVVPTPAAPAPEAPKTGPNGGPRIL